MWPPKKFATGWRMGKWEEKGGVGGAKERRGKGGTPSVGLCPVFEILKNTLSAP